MNDQPPQDNDGLLARVQMLEQLVANLLAQVAQQQNPLRPYFIAKLTDGAATFQERTVIDGEWADFEDGRVCDDEEHESAAMDMESDDVLLVAVRDGEHTRHIKIRSGTPVVACRITGSATMPGIYHAVYVVRNTTDVDPTASASYLDLGTYFDDGEVCLFVNLAEHEVTTGAALPVGEYVLGYTDGADANDVPIVWGHVGDLFAC